MPAKIGGEHELVGGGVNASGKADTGTLKPVLGMLVAQSEQAFRKGQDAARRVPGQRHGGPGEEIAVEIDGSEGGATGTDVRDQQGKAIVQRDVGWPASAGGLDGLTFADPAFVDELLDDGRDGGVLETGVTNEVDPRDGLMRAYELEDDVAVDLAGEFGRCDFNVSKIADHARCGVFVQGRLALPAT